MKKNLNKLDEIDDFLYKNTDKIKYEAPKELTDNIRRTIRNIDDKKYGGFSFFKKVAAIMCSVILIGGVAISAYKVTNNNIKISRNKGMYTAIQNGYIYDDIENEIESSDVKVNIDSLVMDDTNLNFKIEFDISKLDKEFSGIPNVLYPDLIVYDENKNILYCADKATFDSFCRENNLNLKFGEENKKYNTSGITNYTDREKADDKDKITSIIQIYSKNNFPKSKKVYFDLSSIQFKMEDKETYNLKGNWKINLDLPEKFYNRESIIYHVTSCSMPEINVTECIVHNTETNFEFMTYEEPWYDENDSEEEKQKKINEHRERNNEKIKQSKTNEDFDNLSIVDDIYLENENGKRFYNVDSSSEDAGSLEEQTGKVQYWQTFSYTKYDATNKIKIVFKYRGQDVEINLER